MVMSIIPISLIAVIIFVIALVISAKEGTTKEEM